jgi:serine/threonine protein kinase/Tfp pilus assembly protein PilF
MQMTPDNWNKVKALFEAALALEPSERAAFLGQSCPEADLRQQVERLLSNYQEAGRFLSDPGLDPRIPTPRQMAEIGVAKESADFGAGSGVGVATATSVEVEDAMVGRRIGAYKLVRRVGQGGMAAVYQAERADGEFQQQVAVKLVWPGMDKEEILGRFRRERQTLAGLDHANIVKLLDGGSTAEGLPYLVMDYVEGSPIDEYCDQHKLGVEERLRLFIKVCDAVEYAHQKRVIHRDLKPSNILVTAEGIPKLLDFGIAKVLEPTAWALSVTQTSTRCMTPAYASPEQVRGGPTTTATDVYSLGVVLYELLTGHRPYGLKEYTPSEIERAICEQVPEPPSTAVSGAELRHLLTPSPGSERGKRDGKVGLAPASSASSSSSGAAAETQEKLRRRLCGDLDNIVLKALEKEPQRRYPSPQGLACDIERHLSQLPITARPPSLSYRAMKFVQRHKTEVSTAVMGILVLASAAAIFGLNAFRARGRLAGGTPAPQIQSLAVLPLLNLSGDPAQEYFSDGVTDTLITELAQIGSLKVISRTSSMQYKETKKSLPEIARELNVDGIIEGTVQRSGDRVRINAQLIQGPTDKHLWANSYERDLRDVFALEKDVTGDIARQVQAKLKTPDQATSAQPRPVNPKVLEAYLQGNYHLQKFSRGSGDEEKRKAWEFFQQAIDADPGFAPAYVGLSEAHNGTMQGSIEDEVVERKAAEKAVELDPTLSEAWKNLGDVRFDSWDWRGAEESYRRAIALNPNNAVAHEYLGDLLDDIGRLEEGWSEYQLAQQLDPNHNHLHYALYKRREYDRAIQLNLTMLESDPNNGYLHHQLYESYSAKGMYKEAVQQLEQAAILFGLPEEAPNLRRAFALSGYAGAMREWAKELEHLHATKQAFLPVNLAVTYAALGDKDRAFYWLEEGYKHRGQSSAGTDFSDLRVYRGLDPLRSDPRFADLLRRMGLPP